MSKKMEIGIESGSIFDSWNHMCGKLSKKKDQSLSNQNVNDSKVLTSHSLENVKKKSPEFNAINEAKKE